MTTLIVIAIVLVVFLIIVFAKRKKTGKVQKQEILSPQDRHIGLYYLQFEFIPSLVETYNHGGHPEKMFLNIRDRMAVRQLVMGNMFRVEWEHLLINQQENDGLLYVIYTFPEPREVPEAKYGAVVIDPKKEHASYFTMEKSFDGYWMMCGVVDGTHLNFGSIDDDMDVQTFVNRVMEMK